ncbi:helix-turn-helix domain-containing protein [Marispirochaeta aestuarii]|uniref:helix-turn-helix domain-containing protein n=1 Tax=Marispirochaeta aestuarii TaxID=1963862 RepID=UPI002ABDAC2E|nr:helix-turn-helix domain-containing protein [Marispirochaeta aestuarii]
MFHPDEYFNLFICGLCIVMALGLMIKPRNPRNSLLAIFLLFVSYVQLISIFISSRVIYQFPYLAYTQIPFGYTLSPLIYLYIRSFTRKEMIVRPVDVLHFTPTLFLATIVLLYLRLPHNEKIRLIDRIYSGHSSFAFLAGISLFMFVVYTVIITIKVYTVFHKENPLHRRIIKIFLLFSSWIVLSIIKIIGAWFQIDLLWRSVSFLYSVELLLLYFLLQRFPILLSFAHITVEDKESQKKTILDSVDIESLENNIEIMLEEEKLFCDEDLTLNRFSHALEVSAHQLSAFLNTHYGKNFNSFINGYRIRHACDQIQKDPEMNILSIAFSCGFNSYSAFFTAFKKETDLSPREYKGSCSKP